MSIHNNFEQFQTLESTQEFFQGIPDNCKENILHVLGEDSSSESIEVMDDIPELESENYKIDKEMSVAEKLNNGWKKIDNIDIFIRDYRGGNKISVLRKDLTPDEKDEKNKAFVREYIDDGLIPKEYVGEQKFNRFAVQKIGLTDRLPKNHEEFKKIQGNIKNKDFLNKYFSKNNKSLFSGYWESSINVFMHVGWSDMCRFGNGGSIEFENDDSFCIRGNGHYQLGLSVRLVKGR